MFALAIIALSLRLEVSDREEPKLDFEDLFLRSFIKLLISVMCYSLIFSMIDFKVCT